YATAQELADDLNHFQNNEPIKAKRPNSFDLIAKWMRRHQTLAMSMVAALLVVVACLAVTTALIGGALQRTRVAQRHALLQRDAALYNLYVADIRLAHEEWENGNLTAVEQLLDGHLPAGGQGDLRGWEWYYLKSLCHRDVATLRGHTAAVQTVAWSPDGQRLASAGHDFAVKVWDAATHEELTTLRGHTDLIYSIAWSPDGSQIASTGWDKTVRVWDVANGETVLEIPASDEVLRHVAWSPDGLRLATCGDDGLVRVWDAKTGKGLLQMKSYIAVVWSVAWSPDGRRLATGGNYEKRDIRIWDTGTGRQIKQILHAHDNVILDVAWSPDGRQLATASHTVRIWDTETWQRRLKIDAHNGTARSVSWSPDGAELATAGADGSVKLWGARDGRLLNVLRGHHAGALSVKWRSDGGRLASASADHTVKIWDPHEEQPSTTVRSGSGYSWSLDGRRLATVMDKDSDDHGPVLQIVDMESSTSQRLPFPPSDKFTIHAPIAWSPDGSRVACKVEASNAPECLTKVFDRATLAEIYSLEVPDVLEVRSIAWSPGARYLATAQYDEAAANVIIWDMSTGGELARLKHDDPTDSVAWSPDGRRIATSSWDQIVKIWEVGTWREMLQLNRHPDFRGISAGGEHIVAWTPDGSKLAAGTARGWFIMWDATTGREVLSFKAHTAAVRSIAISPDGLRIATASKDRSVKVWDTAGRQLLTLRGHTRGVDSVAWSPSGAQLISSGGGGLKIWSVSREMGETD
ncbi:MAG: hypothetical protein ACC645_15010, partial [Pirellulales bacterium]